MNLNYLSVCSGIEAATEPDPKADEQKEEDLGKEYAETAAAEAATPRRRQRR